MPWCPKCKNEYREGFTMCTECKVELVDSLEDEEASEAPFAEVGFELTEEEAAAFVEAEPEDFGEELQDEERDTKPVFYHAYQNSAEKAEDNRSSASALLVVGGAGFIADLLIFLNIIPIYHNNDTSKYLVCGVMGAMFVLFIVFGVVSMRTSKLLFKKAEAEDSLRSEMLKWCQENMNANEVDAGLFEGEDLEEEQMYFKRAEKMKGMISDKFLNLDEAFLEHFVDEYYQTLYGET